MPRNRLLIKKEIEAYAEVLLELGESTDSVYSISAQLEEMKKVVRMHPGLRDVLANDSIDENTRATVIHEVFKEFSVDMIKFVIVMAERQDIPLLQGSRSAMTRWSRTSTTSSSSTSPPSFRSTTSCERSLRVSLPPNSARRSSCVSMSMPGCLAART